MVTKLGGKSRIQKLVFADRDEANTAIERVAEYERQIAGLATICDAEIALARSNAADEIRPLADLVKQNVAGLAAYFAANRGKLTEDGKRISVDLPAGTIGEYKNPSRVELVGEEDIIIAAIKKLGLGDKFVRVTETINRQALLAEPDLARTISGISIEQDTEFRVRPADFGIDPEISRLKKKLPRPHRE